LHHPVKQLSRSEIYRAYRANRTERRYQASDYQQLGNLVANLPKRGDGGVNWGPAVTAARQHADICREAAAEYLDRLVSKKSQNIPSDMLDEEVIRREVSTGGTRRKLDR